MSAVAGAGGARQGILSLAIKDKSALYNAYMPYLKSGGIFAQKSHGGAHAEQGQIARVALQPLRHEAVGGRQILITHRDAGQHEVGVRQLRILRERESRQALGLVEVQRLG